MPCSAQSSTRSGTRAIVPSSFMTSQITPAGCSPARRARSTEASVWPVRSSTPCGRARSGKTWPGWIRSLGARRRDRRRRGWCARGRRRRCPVETPSRASIETVNAVSYGVSLCCGHHRQRRARRSARASASGRSGRGACVAMKLMASAVTSSAAMHQVALVLAVGRVDDDHHPAGPDVLDRVLDAARTASRRTAPCTLVYRHRCRSDARSAKIRHLLRWYQRPHRTASRSTYLPNRSASRLTRCARAQRSQDVTSRVCGMTATANRSRSGGPRSGYTPATRDRALLHRVAQHRVGGARTPSAPGRPPASPRPACRRRRRGPAPRGRPAGRRRAAPPRGSRGRPPAGRRASCSRERLGHGVERRAGVPSIAVTVRQQPSTATESPSAASARDPPARRAPSCGAGSTAAPLLDHDAREHASAPPGTQAQKDIGADPFGASSDTARGASRQSRLDAAAEQAGPAVAQERGADEQRHPVEQPVVQQRAAAIAAPPSTQHDLHLALRRAGERLGEARAGHVSTPAASSAGGGRRRAGLDDHQHRAVARRS